MDLLRSQFFLRFRGKLPRLVQHSHDLCRKFSGRSNLTNELVSSDINFGGTFHCNHSILL